MSIITNNTSNLTAMSPQTSGGQFYSPRSGERQEFGILMTLNLGDYEMLAGNLASIGVGGIVAYVASMIVRIYVSSLFG